MKPDYNVLQATIDPNGNRQLRRVGAMWSNTSKNGNPYFSLKIGELSLLVFENTDKPEEYLSGENARPSNGAGKLGTAGAGNAAAEREADAEMDV